jgi:hypothetical protein
MKRNFQKTLNELDAVTNTCNPSYSRGRDQEDGVQGQPKQKARGTLSQSTSEA